MSVCIAHNQVIKLILLVDYTPSKDDENADTKEEMFIRSGGIVSELYTTILRKMLCCIIPPSDSADIARKIRNISSKEWKTAMLVANRGNYDDCDFNLAYLFIVHSLEPRDQPKSGWGNPPDESDKGLGDDVERMRISKEILIKQSDVERIEKDNYDVMSNESLEICKRMDNINPAFPSTFYVELEELIRTQPLDATIRNRYKCEIQQMAAKEKEMQEGQTHFARMCKIVLELNPSILQEILQELLPHNDCKNKAQKLKILRPEQLNITNDVPTNGYKDCDTTLMYTLIRNLCAKIPRPKSGWGNKVNSTDIGIGDDIERIRQRRNGFGHSPLAFLGTSDYNALIQDSKGICRRMDSLVPCAHSQYMGKNKPQFLPKLENIEKEFTCISKAALHEYIKRLDDMNKAEIDTREKIDFLSMQIKIYHEEEIAAGRKFHLMFIIYRSKFS